MKGQERSKGHAPLQVNLRLMGCQCLTSVSGHCLYKWFMSASGWLLTGLMLPQVHVWGERTSNTDMEHKELMWTLPQRWVWWGWGEQTSRDWGNWETTQTKLELVIILPFTGFCSPAPVFYFGEVEYHVDESDGHVEVKVWRTGTDLSKPGTITVRSRKAEPISADGELQFIQSKRIYWI